MKKLFIVVLLLMFLCSCTDKEATPDRDNRKNVSSSRMTSTPKPTATSTPTPIITERIRATATPKPTATATPTCTPVPLLYMAKKEVVISEVYSGKVQIMDTMFTLPCKLGELLVLSDITLEQSRYSSLDGYDPLNNTYRPESRNTLIMTFPDGSEAELEVENLGLEFLPLEELYITQMTSQSPYIIFPKGVQVGNNCAILKEWGDYDNLASGSYVGRYSYYEAEYEMDYSGTREIGVKFEIDVNNTTYNIDKITYVPAFYVDFRHVTETVRNYYPKDLKYELPIALTDGWKAGLLVYDNREFIVEYTSSYLYETPETPEALLMELGRAMKYYNEERGYWDYYLDTSKERNEKVIVQDGEPIRTVINYWDYSDALEETGVIIDGKAMFPRKDSWKSYAEVGIMYEDYIDLWMFSVSAIDHGEIPEDVMNTFRQVVQRMAETVVEYEEK